MQFHVWLLAICVVVALHAAVWFVFIYSPTNVTSEYLQFSVVDARIMTASHNPVGQPVTPKRIPQASPRPRKQSQPSPNPPEIIKRTVSAPVSLPAIPQTTRVEANISPELYTEPKYGASYLHNPPPIYPMIARRLGISGRVLVRTEVTIDGHCQNAHILKSSGYSVLDNAALAAVKKWRFIPATRGSEPVTATVDIPLNFTLRGES